MPSTKAIGFDTFVGNTTKATANEMDLDELKATGFYVWGGHDGLTDLFAQKQVTWNTSAWTYEPLRYWEANESYKFAAFAPGIGTATATFNYNDGHVDLTDYVADINTFTDLVYATQTANTTAETGNNTVSFTFGHKLSWIKIKFVNGFADGTKLTVTDVTVTGVKNKANFTDGNFGTPTDDAVMTEVDLTQTDENDNAQTVDFTAIPQTISSFVISFKVSVETKAGDVLATAEAKTATLPNVTWVANNVYCYTATIDGSTIGMQAITFDASVSGWSTPETNTDVAIQ